MSETLNCRYIDTEQKLLDFCHAIKGQPWLVIDTEFMRERSYRPELCLIQLKYQDHLALIDPLALDSLTPLADILTDPDTVKVFHAGTQDLEIFYQELGEIPRPLFDTQLAAPLLGYAEQLGYANLVREELGVELQKAHTRADWSRRPLSDGELRYALDDVIYLERLYCNMRQRLEELGRLAWLDDEFEALQAVERFESASSERWKRIRQIERYRGATLSIIQALAHWRELKASELNKPRNWLLKDEQIISLARAAPADSDALSRIRGLDQGTLKRHGEELLGEIRLAREQAPEPLPKRERRKKLSPYQQAQAQLLKAWVCHRAAELDIAPGLLLPDKLLESVISQPAKASLTGWRKALLAQELTDLQSGASSIRIQAGGLGLHPSAAS